MTSNTNANANANVPVWARESALADVRAAFATSENVATIVNAELPENIAAAFNTALVESGVTRLSRKCEIGGATGVYGIGLFVGKSKAPAAVYPLNITRSRFAMGRAYTPADGAALYVPATSDNLSAVYPYIDVCGRQQSVKRTANGLPFVRSFTLTRWVRSIVEPIFAALVWAALYRGGDASVLTDARSIRYRVAIVTDFDVTA